MCLWNVETEGFLLTFAVSTMSALIRAAWEVLPALSMGWFLARLWQIAEKEARRSGLLLPAGALQLRQLKQTMKLHPEVGSLNSAKGNYNVFSPK